MPWMAWIPMNNQALGIRYQVIRYQVLGISYQVLAIRYQVLGIRHQALGSRHQALGIRHQALGIRHQVLGIRYQVVIRYQVFGLRYYISKQLSIAIQMPHPPEINQQILFFEISADFTTSTQITNITSHISKNVTRSAEILTIFIPGREIPKKRRLRISIDQQTRDYGHNFFQRFHTQIADW